MVVFRPTRVSVPGKVILMGEHAVVYGCPGLVAAAGARVTLSIEPMARSGVEVIVPSSSPTAVALEWNEVFATSDRARRLWRSRQAGVMNRVDDCAGSPVDDEVRFLAMSLGETLEGLGLGPGHESHGLVAPLAQELPGFHLEVTSELPVGGGMGSSAAVAVAVVVGVAASLGRTLDYEEVDAIAFEIESRQHGRPSGIDNASVLRGGVLWFERHLEDAQGEGDELLIEPLDLDESLLRDFRLFNTGQPNESTGETVSAVRRLQQHRTAWFDLRLSSMTTTCHAMRRALVSHDDPTEMIRGYQHELEAIGVVPGAVARIVREIESAGGAAKISGAGAITGSGAGALLVYHPDHDLLESLPCLSGLERLQAPLAVDGATVDSHSLGGDSGDVHD